VGWRLLPLGAAERGELERLFQACADYVQLVEGRPPSSEQADELLGELPPGSSPDDKHVLGVRDAAGRLVGVVEVVRGYPARGAWFLGLLLLLPSERGRGAGERVYRAVESWVRGQGADAMYLAVVEQNPRATRFWERLGFERVYERPARVGVRDTVAVRMVRRVAPGPGEEPPPGVVV
jgi:GNAT superfamily N-acetyltransferase